MKRVLWLAFVGIVVASSSLSAQEPKLQGAHEYCDRGQAYLDQGECDKAIADYTEAIRLDPNSTDAYFNRGIAYQKKGDKAKAEEDSAQAKKLGYKEKQASDGSGPIR